jgi:hypothetical protein
MIDFLSRLDKRWIFLAMLLAVSIPILLQKSFPETTTQIVQDVFDKIESLPEGSRVLISFDFDPASGGELDPMATAFVRHLCLKKHKIYFMALWPVGSRSAEDTIARVIKADFPEMKYGVDYVNLGYKSGGEGVIQVIVDNLRKLYPSDGNGTNLSSLEMTKDIRNVRQMALILSVSAGTGGAKEWIQYAATPYGIPTAVGCTGVQAPLFYPYYPNQMLGMLPALKGAAEYEAAIATKYPKYASPEHNEGLRRMSPQQVAHLLMVTLIIVGNIVFFAQRRKGAAA